MAIFRFFLMADVRHLGFSNVGNFNFRSHSEAQCASLYQILRRSVKPFRRYGRFSILQDGGRRHLGFWKFHIFNGWVAQESRTASACQNFVEIAQTAAEIWRFFIFSRWRPSAIFDWFYACWEHPRRVLGGLCDYAKFGGNRYSNFDSMQILIFCTLSLKMPIHASKIGVLGDFAPKIGSSMNDTPKRHILGRKHVVRRIDRQNRTTCARSASAEV